MLRASELAKELKLSKGRISQLVGAGKLDGCFDGHGQQRRFDLGKVVAALGRRLDPGQMLGNGAETRRTLARLSIEDEAEAEPSARSPARPSEVLPRGDNDRYELARTAKAEEDLRSARLKNGREEGLYVLASEVERQMARVMAQEVAEIDAFLKDAARLVADQMQVDFKATKKVLMDAWRTRRQERSTVLQEGAGDATLSDAEKAAQI